MLRNQKLLSVEGKTITLLRPRKLAQLCGFSSDRPSSSCITHLWDHAEPAGLNGHGGAFLTEEARRRESGQARRCAQAVASL
jgi:hypothetical protein